MEPTLMNFELNRETGNSIIKVIGVGGGGCNAVDHMYRQGIKGVDFIVCNTDQQALDKSPVPNKISLGMTLTEGLGAGSIPEVGKNAAIESIEEIKAILGTKTKMVFITAGMGGGTGTGAAPVIAAATKEMGILTVAIVTIPFNFEGKRRKAQADQGIEELKKNVDTLLIICNDKLREIYGNLKMTDAFGHADNVLTTGAKGIAEIITEKLHVNTDFADIQTVLRESGVAIMGSASASGENRAVKAVQEALSSPLLNDSDIRGARHVLLNVKCGSGEYEISMDEFGEITDFLQEAAGGTAEVIQGYGIDDTLNDTVVVTIIATGFNNKKDVGYEVVKPVTRKVHSLSAEPVVVSAPALEVNPSPTFTLPSENHAEPEIISRETELRESREEIQLTIESSFLTSAETEIESEIDNATEENAQSISISEAERKLQERKESLKRFSWPKTNRNIQEMENTPAYIRKQKVLENPPASSESQISRFTLGEGEDNKAEIRSNNSFLHDNVD